MTTAMRFAHHGGALDAARAAFPDAPEPWIDLSTGINPQAYPVGALPVDAWTRLPEAAALAGLEAAAVRRYGCPPGVAVVAAPGTQAIIQRLPALFAGRDIRILGRTYGEYARVFAAAGAAVQVVAALGDLAGADVAVVVNPNNPDGRLVDPAALVALSTEVGALVVDEAFVDALPPGHSVVPHLPAARMLGLRSFGKFYGLAGLRLGFAVARLDLAAVLRDTLGPWAVSGPALEIGARALADTAWVQASRTRLVAEAARLDALLAGAGMTLIGGTPLFRLAASAQAASLFDALARAGILTRPFADNPTWLRFGLPESEDAWVRLDRVLAAFSG
ncbi:threonine-phosphate decarboxylase CobD [Beijerinckia sp. L45]|uniref:threonine-phosphate decarboxylase CobD n=1 Tax=Beijerinckia sp. L45 TaxID=1641855 RepID=UPI00131E6794|nr:threonine-phosphate decarboxylase CobD [Beijerinckia sp. L45]